MGIFFLGCIFLSIGIILAFPLKGIRSPITSAFVIAGSVAIILGLLKLHLLFIVGIIISALLTLIGGIGLITTRSHYMIGKFLLMTIIGATFTGYLLRLILH